MSKQNDPGANRTPLSSKSRVFFQWAPVKAPGGPFRQSWPHFCGPGGTSGSIFVDFPSISRRYFVLFSGLLVSLIFRKESEKQHKKKDKLVK